MQVHHLIDELQGLVDGHRSFQDLILDLKLLNEVAIGHEHVEFLQNQKCVTPENENSSCLAVVRVLES